MFSLNLHGRLVEFPRPAIMAIINATDDSFYFASRFANADAISRRVEQVISEGADIIDLGAYSSHPGAPEVSVDTERKRLVEAVKAVRKVSRDIPLSVDTFRASVAATALEAGADIVNDISGGLADPEMDALIARENTPYVIMHMRGTPQTMQQFTDYSAEGSVAAAVMTFFARRINELTAMGATQLILDPGFGFAKTTEQNWQLMRELSLIHETFPARPILVGLSRKSMLYKPLDLSPDEVLPATLTANLLAIQAGAQILRVHDPAPTLQMLRTFQML